MRGVKRVLLAVVLAAGVVSVPVPAHAAPPGWREVELPFLWPRRTLPFVEASGANDVWVAGAQGQVGIPQPGGGTYWTLGNPVVRRLKDGRWHEYPLDGWPGFSSLTGLSAHGADVFVTGASDLPYVAKFDGTRFRRVPVPADMRRVHVRTGPGGTWAVANQWHDRALLRLVNGAFEKVELPAGYLLHDVVAVGPNDVWAVGRRGEGDQTVPAAVRWNGTTWTSVPVPGLDLLQDSLYQVTVTTSGELWATDTSFEHSSVFTNLLRWTGSAWTKVTKPEGARSGITSDGSGRLVMIGEVSTGTGGTVPALYRWTGSGWQTTEFPSSTPFYFADVAGAAGTSNLWTVGHRDMTPVVQTNAP